MRQYNPSIHLFERGAMHSEDRVLVAIMTSPADFTLARDEGWYRIPHHHAPKGVHAEYLAFYFNRAFGDQKWAIHYYGRNLGHELVHRRDLFPDQANHPRANKPYYKIQLGPLQKLERPIVSLRWRRISFIYTTWDRFVDSTEINDLFVEGTPYVDRLYYALREAGIFPERDYQIREGDAEYQVDLAIPCQNSTVSIVIGDKTDPTSSLRLAPDKIEQNLTGCTLVIKEQIKSYGGLRPKDLQTLSPSPDHCQVTKSLKNS